MAGCGPDKAGPGLNTAPWWPRAELPQEMAFAIGSFSFIELVFSHRTVKAHHMTMRVCMQAVVCMKDDVDALIFDELPNGTTEPMKTVT